MRAFILEATRNFRPLWVLHGFTTAEKYPAHAEFAKCTCDALDQFHTHIPARVTPDIAGRAAAVAAIGKIEDNQWQRMQPITNKIQEIFCFHESSIVIRNWKIN